MAIVTAREIIDLIIMTVAVGFIFKDVFRPVVHDYEPLQALRRRMNLQNFKFALLVTAPAIVLHEAAHKFAALAFGIPAVFHAHLPFLALGVILKLAHFPFIFVVPGYVAFPVGAGAPAQIALIAFAGPALNLLLFLTAAAAIRFRWKPKYAHLWVLTRQINLFLFIFNMIPFGPFDGASVFRNLLAVF